MSDDTYIREAFEETVKDAVQAEDSQIFLCLYAEIPFYGGPEEGGWWGADVELISHKRYPTEDQAQAALKKVTSLAESLSQNAHRQYGEQCLRDMDWLDQRGLEADYLPEPDGPTKFYTVLEDVVGGMAYKGDRMYS